MDSCLHSKMSKFTLFFQVCVLSSSIGKHTQDRGINKEHTQEESKHLKEGLLEMKERTKMLKDTILQQDNDFMFLEVRCAQTAANITRVGEQSNNKVAQKAYSGAVQQPFS